MDLRVGGRHFARMEARDGAFGLDFEGIYEEVEAANALTLRLDDGRSARTTFTAEGRGTPGARYPPPRQEPREVAAQPTLNIWWAPNRPDCDAVMIRVFLLDLWDLPRVS